MCLLALHKMHQSCAGLAYTVFINYVVFFLIEEPLRKALIIMFNFHSTVHYAVNTLDQNVQGHEKYHKKRIFLSSGLLSSQCQSMYRYINNTACACPILFLWSRDDLDRFIRFWASNIALLEFRLVHSIHWGAARLISFLDHLLRSVPQNRDLVQNTVFNFIASAVYELNTQPP